MHHAPRVSSAGTSNPGRRPRYMHRHLRTQSLSSIKFGTACIHQIQRSIPIHPITHLIIRRFHHHSTMGGGDAYAGTVEIENDSTIGTYAQHSNLTSTPNRATDRPTQRSTPRHRARLAHGGHHLRRHLPGAAQGPLRPGPPGRPPRHRRCHRTRHALQCVPARIFQLRRGPPRPGGPPRVRICARSSVWSIHV